MTKHRLVVDLTPNYAVSASKPFTWQILRNNGNGWVGVKSGCSDTYSKAMNEAKQFYRERINAETGKPKPAEFLKRAYKSGESYVALCTYLNNLCVYSFSKEDMISLLKFFEIGGHESFYKNRSEEFLYDALCGSLCQRAIAESSGGAPYPVTQG